MVRSDSDGEGLFERGAGEPALSLRRRELLKRGGMFAAAGLALPSILAACGGSDSDSGGSAASTSGAGGKPTEFSNKTVVFATYGGSTAEALKKAYFDPFAKESGVQVKNASMDPARFFAMAEAGRSQWDSGDVDGFDGIALADMGAIEKLPDWVTRAGIPDTPKLAGYRNYFNSSYSYSWVMAYKTSTFKGAKPESLADFWNAQKFPGKRAWPKLFISTIEAALTADGVKKDALYPLDIDRAVSKLDELRPNVGLFYDSFAQAAQALNDGDVSLAWLPSSHIVNLQREGVDAQIVWNEAVNYPWGALPVPKGSPNAEGMFGLLDFMAQPEPEAEFTKLTGYGPPNPEALKLIDDETLKYVPNSPENKKIAVEVDAVAVAKQSGEYIERYGKWLAKS